MPIIANKKEGFTSDPAPAGNHLAICYSMVEIGTEEFEYLGVKKKAHKVRISWELCHEKKVFKPENGEQPFVLSRDYTLSMHEKSTLRGDLESWRGRAFTEDEAKAFDITVLIGKPCMLNVIHTEKNGNTYANISNVTSLPKGMAMPPQTNPSLIFSYADSTLADFEKLPEWLRDRMKKTPEYGKLTNRGHEESAPSHVPDMESNLPF